MPRTPVDPTGTAVQRTIRLTPSALAVIDAQRLPGEKDSAVVNRLLTTYGVDRARERHPTARPAPVQQTLGCVHKDFHKLSFGGWVCNACGAVSRDFGMTWHAATGGG